MNNEKSPVLPNGEVGSLTLPTCYGDWKAVSGTPKQYRLAQKPDGTLILQGLLEWFGPNHTGGADWQDLPTHILEESEEKMSPEQTQLETMIPLWLGYSSDEYDPKGYWPPLDAAVKFNLRDGTPFTGITARVIFERPSDGFTETLSPVFVVQDEKSNRKRVYTLEQVQEWCAISPDQINPTLANLIIKPVEKTEVPQAAQT